MTSGVFLQALYENMLVELPFASFFLSKLLGTSADVDIHHLASLDPEMYRNLLFLKSYEEDVEELGLNFTVVNNDLGEAQVTTVWVFLIFFEFFQHSEFFHPPLFPINNRFAAAQKAASLLTVPPNRRRTRMSEAARCS